MAASSRLGRQLEEIVTTRRGGAHAWIEKDQLVRLDASWRGAMGAPELRAVAEPESPSYETLQVDDL